MFKKFVLNLIYKIIWYILIFFVIVVFIFPLLWVLLSSFKTQADIVRFPPSWIFKPIFDNYIRVFVEQNFFQYLWNSSLIAVLSTLFSLIIGLPGAYSISKFKQTMFGLFILVARLLPGISFLIPWFILFSKLHLIDTYAALVASHMLISLPLIVWIMVNYFDQIPSELEESACVDGCSIQSAFLKIILPISGPGILTGATLSFLFSWNNFMFAMVLSSQRTKTLPIAIYNFVSYAEVNWGSVMAAAVIIIAPAIFLTMIFQKFVIRGLTMGAVKG